MEKVKVKIQVKVKVIVMVFGTPIRFLSAWDSDGSCSAWVLTMVE